MMRYQRKSPPIIRRKKVASPRKNFLNFANVITLLTLIIALTALFFSWQANQIAIKQSSELLSWNITRFYGNNIVSSSATSCAYRVTLYNFGGLSTSLIDFDTTLYFKEK